jgi:predicted TIM-barrel fold metal-dependent hydrolase
MQPDPGVSGKMEPKNEPTLTHLDIQDTTPTDGLKTVNLGQVQQPPKLMIDSHMHIMSANTLPLPCLQERVPVIGTWFHAKRSTINWFGKNMDKLAMGAEFLIFAPAAGIHAARTVALSGRDVDGEILYESRMVKGTKTGLKDTDQVGAAFLRRIAKARETFRSQDPYGQCKSLEVFTVSMTMDMEYAHLLGYFGIPIYHPIYKMEKGENGKPDKQVLDGYWYPVHAVWKKEGDQWVPTDPGKPPARVDAGDPVMRDDFEKLQKESKEHGIPGAIYSMEGPVKGVQNIQCIACEAPKEEIKMYETWTTQLQRTEMAMCDGRLQLLPMFHYDPRRWQSLDQSEAFANVAGNGLYLGFKMYTAQGYRPWDINRLPKLRSFYKKCAEDDIPIMNHCTPGGANTYDMESYLYFHHHNDKDEEEAEKKDYRKTGVREVQVGKNQTVMREYDDSNRIGYFQENYVSPKAWEKVLKEFPKLRLCLAHYCGGADFHEEWHDQILPMLKNYDNFYVDISSSLSYGTFRDAFKDKLVTKDTEHKILFGTDWYMCMLGRLDAMDHDEYFEKGKKFVEGIGKRYWEQFTEINPCRFYRIEGRIQDIAKALKKQRDEPETQKSQIKIPESQPANQPGTQTSDKKKWNEGDMDAIDARAQRIKDAAAGARKRDTFKPGGGQ